MTYRIERLGGRAPVIHPGMFQDAGVPEDGTSINGASVIRVPDWIPPERRAHPDARYYLYFAHHHGHHIRMAWSTAVTGPYRLFSTHAIDESALAQPSPRAGRGVLELPIADDGSRVLRFSNGVEVRGHIASPDVHVDADARRIVMYFHGTTNTSTPPPHATTGPQKSLVATSADGLSFEWPERGGAADHGPQPVLLGNAYFRVFDYGEYRYAFSNGGELWRAPVGTSWQPADPPTADAWVSGPNPILDLVSRRGPGLDPRHFALRFLSHDRLEVFYSVRGAVNESIERTELSLTAGDWRLWRAEDFETVLSPDEEWEGAGRPPAPSRPGGETGVRQLRDPAVFTDTDGRTYLFYSGGGEEAIGVAAQ